MVFVIPMTPRCISPDSFKQHVATCCIWSFLGGQPWAVVGRVWGGLGCCWCSNLGCVGAMCGRPRVACVLVGGDVGRLRAALGKHRVILGYPYRQSLGRPWHQRATRGIRRRSTHRVNIIEREHRGRVAMGALPTSKLDNYTAIKTSN